MVSLLGDELALQRCAGVKGGFMERKFNPDVLPELTKSESTPCVSIFMPCVKAGPETRQNAIRFGNLLREVRRQLSSYTSVSAAQPKMDEADELLSSYEFWQHQDLGLALFANSEEFFYYKLPLAVDEIAYVGENYLLTPLVSLAQQIETFFLLAIDLENPRFYEGNIYGLTPVVLEGAPRGIEAITQYREARKQLQHHAPTPSPSPGRDGVFHAHDPSEQEKVVIKEYIYALQEAVIGYLRGRNAPLVISGVEYITSMYADVNAYDHLLSQPLHGSNAKLTDLELHALSMKHLENRLSETAAAVGEFEAKNGTGLTATGTDDVLRQARLGRVSVLLLPESPEHDELTSINEAALHAIRTNAEIVTLPPGSLPADSHVAAILRY
jgi:hypothetical protein